MVDIVLSIEQAQTSLNATLQGLRGEATVLRDARVASADDHFKLLETVGPIMARVQFPIITPFGYTQDDDGHALFTARILISHA